MMKKASTLILRLALLAMALIMLGVCFGIGWVVIAEGKPGSQYRYLDFILIIVAYLAAIPYFITLFQSERLLCLIDRGLAFSDQSVKVLTTIIRSIFAVFSVCVVGGLPLFYMAAEIDDAPGLIIVGLAITGLVFSIDVFAYVLRRLLQEAIEFKRRAEV